MLVRVLYTRPDAKSRGVHVPTWCILFPCTIRWITFGYYDSHVPTGCVHSSRRTFNLSTSFGFARTYVAHLLSTTTWGRANIEVWIRTYSRATSSMKVNLLFADESLIRTYSRATSAVCIQIGRHLDSLIRTYSRVISQNLMIHLV